MADHKQRVLSHASRAQRRYQAVPRRGENRSRATRVTLRIDSLALPAGGDETAVRRAVDSALRQQLVRRLAQGSPVSALHRSVTSVLGDPLPADPAAVADVVASEVIRAVLS